MADDNRVKISVEVEFPPSLVQAIRRRDREYNAVITVPRPTNEGDTNARLLGLDYVICARGSGVTGARHVFAGVFAADPGAAPPSGTKWVRPTGDNWEFSHLNNMELPITALNTNNTFYLWVDDGTAYDRTTRTFRPINTGMTDCGAGTPGSGTGSGSMAGSGSGAFSPVTFLASETVPRLLTVIALGFTHEKLAVFNAQWLLSLRPSAEQVPVWDNAADGKSAPLVELRQEGSLWVLTFRHGSNTVRFSKPTAEWQPLSSNVLAHANPGVAKGIPNFLTIVPV